MPLDFGPLWGGGGGWFSWGGVGWLDQVRIRPTQLSNELKVEAELGNVK